MQYARTRKAGHSPMNDGQPALEALASTLVKLRARPVDPTTLDRVRQCLFDALCAAHVSSHFAGLDRLEADPALANMDKIAICVAAARASEMDDIHIASCITAGSVATVCAVFLGADLRSSDAQVVAAIVEGYEVMIRLGLAIDGPKSVTHGIWPSMLAAPMGAAAVASSLLGLDEDHTADALALAAARSSATAWFSDEPSGRWLQ